MAVNHLITLDELLERLRRKVHVAENGCWIWGADNGRHKYIRLGGKEGKNFLLHRVVWEKMFGPIPDGRYVCHHCPGGDNPACCNPDHLWLGTHAENLRDAAEKGQMASGFRLPHTKLSEEDVRTIFLDYHVGGQSGYSLAKRFGVGTVHVLRIVNRWRRCRVTDPLAESLGIPRRGYEHE